MRRVLFSACLCSVIALLGCKTAEKRADPPLATITYEGTLDDERDPHAPSAGPVYFGFDEHALSPRAQESLQEVARYMTRSESVRLTIEGHCDDLGTSEYNLALGHSRALAAKSYLTALGVKEERVKVLSFGEERPVMSGTDDEARAKNRRDELAFYSSEEAQTALDDASSALEVVLAWNAWDER